MDGCALSQNVSRNNLKKVNDGTEDKFEKYIISVDLEIKKD